MKVGVITQPNSKGQIVIPKEMRTALGIKPGTPLNLMVRGGGLYIYPVKEVITSADTEKSYLMILKKTKGAWGKDQWRDRSKKKRALELAASKRRKTAW